MHVVLQNAMETPTTMEECEIERDEDVWTMQDRKALCRSRMGSRTGALLMGLKMLEVKQQSPFIRDRVSHCI